MADTVKIAVCDDQKNIRSYLVSLIKRQDIECSIIEYASVDEYLTDGRKHDRVFLDIEMGGSSTKMDGMGLARHIRGIEAQKQPIIIFVTGYEKYVYDAFRNWNISMRREMRLRMSSSMTNAAGRKRQESGLMQIFGMEGKFPCLIWGSY